MKYEIHWSDKAINDLELKLIYLRNYWTNKEVDSFKVTLENI